MLKPQERGAITRDSNMKSLLRLTLSVLIISLVACSILQREGRYFSHASTISKVDAIGSIPVRISLEQNWTDQTRMDFWFTSQGSRIIPYSWFMWLEQADSRALFRDAGHMEQLRYLPVASSAVNPAGLPIGFALDTDTQTGDAWLGLTCAACHTNQLDYQGTKILIEGAPTLANFVLFYQRLVNALTVTGKDDAKFERFAKRVLASDYSAESAAELRNSVLQISLAVAQRQLVNALPATYPADFTSYARLDAFGNIQNAASAFALHDLTNRNPPTAPVSYPFLWGTHQSDVVQWNASAPNTPIVGPLVRNIGEVVGVFGDLSITEAPWWQRVLGKKNSYSSTVKMLGLGHLEAWVKDLRSPQWPQQYLPGIDATKAAQGSVIYQQQCASCHQVITRSDEGQDYIAVKTPLIEVGTDPAMAWNAAHHKANTLILEGTKKDIIVGDKFSVQAPAIELAVNGVVGLVLKNPGEALKAGLIPEEHGKRSLLADELSSIEDYLQVNLAAREKLTVATKAASLLSESELHGLVYKARPLNGIWATAPYLHNGSVPNLWELLQLPEERIAEFWVGSREFDPVRVGYRVDQGLSKYRVRDDGGEVTPGNSNLGHRYGTELSDQQKWSLIEYMKTL